MNNIQNQPKARVRIATPMYGGMCTGAYTESLVALIKECAKEDIEVDLLSLMNESLVSRARNQLVDWFLNDDEATHLLFIDADMAFRADDIVRMVKADLDIICGVCPLKIINWAKVKAAAINGVEARDLPLFSVDYAIRPIHQGAPTDTDTPMEVKYAGTGVMLIKRAVFAKLADSVPQYLGRVIDGDGKNPVPVIREYFAAGLAPEGKELLGEDYHFCKIAREHGIKIHAAPWTFIGHVGTHVFLG